MSKTPMVKFVNILVLIRWKNQFVIVRKKIVKRYSGYSNSSCR